MHKSKLVRYLSVFTQKEIKDLSQIISLELFNNGKRPLKVKALIQYLLLFYPGFEAENVTEEQVFEAVFPDETFKRHKLRKLASESIKVIQHFILFCTPNNQPGIHANMAQVKFFQDRGMDQDFLSAFNRTEKMLETQTLREQEKFYHRFVLETERIKYLLKTNDNKGDVNLPAAIRYLDQFYSLTKMEYCSYLLTQNISTVLDSSQSMILLDEVMETAENHFLDIPVIAAYYHAFPLLKPGQGNMANYENLKKVLSDKADLISMAELKTIHNYMRNFLANRYVNGDRDCVPEFFSLFKEQIKFGTIYQDGHHIWASTLQSAVTLALWMKEHEWAMNFLQKHKNRIKSADDVEGVYQFNLANIYFHQGKYQEAFETLEKFHFREMFYNLAARRLETKLYYETQLELDVFEFRLKALKSFVYEQKKLLPTDKFDSNNNFSKVMFQVFTILREDEERQFLKLSHKKSRTKRIHDLIEKVTQLKTIAEREWLLEKLREKLFEN
ncbi:MAG: hypothetical protein AAFZ15_12850 [Bacteroidota bacterium]